MTGRPLFFRHILGNGRLTFTEATQLELHTEVQSQEKENIFLQIEFNVPQHLPVHVLSDAYCAVSQETSLPQNLENK